MNQEKLKLIVRNLELLVRSLKEEIQDIPEEQHVFPYIDDDVDEYYVEEEDV